MNPQYIENIPFSYDESSTLALVCTLLTELLAGDKDQLVISSRPEGYIYDSTKSVGITNPVRILVTAAELTRNGKRLEITMSGALGGLDDEKHSFSLYFTMKGDTPIVPKKSVHAEKLVGKTLALTIMGATGNLYDSLYSLILQNKNNNKGALSLGEGRGYLVFNSEI